MNSRNVDERINILRAKRNGIKTQLSLFEKFLREFPDSPNILNGLHCKLERRTGVFSTFHDVQAELEILKKDINSRNEQLKRMYLKEECRRLNRLNQETGVSSKPSRRRHRKKRPRRPHSNKPPHRPHSNKPPWRPYDNKPFHRERKLPTLWDWVSFVSYKNSMTSGKKRNETEAGLKSAKGYCKIIRKRPLCDLELLKKSSISYR
ncbi:uncharacterized protein LOC143218760 [Lasioglossum baleicum]|uniref:uncharacterized protein LOC143218760 n=1 Tax=Lasioglossum baleicum TaxID=434251 RepID=UPI003FCEAC84